MATLRELKRYFKASNAVFLYRCIWSYWCKHTCAQVQIIPLVNGDRFIMAHCNKCVEVYGREESRPNVPQWVLDGVRDYDKAIVLCNM